MVVGAADGDVAAAGEGERVGARARVGERMRRAVGHRPQVDRAVVGDGAEPAPVGRQVHVVVAGGAAVQRLAGERARVPALEGLVDALQDERAAVGREDHLAHARRRRRADDGALAVGRDQAHRAVDAPQRELPVVREGGAATRRSTRAPPRRG